MMQREDRKLNRNTAHNPSNDNDVMEFDPEFLRQQRLVSCIVHINIYGYVRKLFVFTVLQ